MKSHALNSQRAKLIVLLTLVLVASMLSPRAAFADPGSAPSVEDFYVTQGVTADATWQTSTEDEYGVTWHYIWLWVTEGQVRSDDSLNFVGTTACINFESWYPDGTFSYETKCLDIPKSQFHVEDLNSATLQPVTFSLDKYYCGQTCQFVGNREVTVAVWWTGIGSVNISGHYNQKVKEGLCTTSFSSDSDWRSAEAAATLNGTSLENTLWAGLSRGKHTFKRSCH